MISNAAPGNHNRGGEQEVNADVHPNVNGGGEEEVNADIQPGAFPHRPRLFERDGAHYVCLSGRVNRNPEPN